MATLNARVREQGGKGVARKLRQSGTIPAVAYGRGEETKSLTVDAHELELLLAHINPENTIIDLKIEGGKTSKALIREIQQHPSRGRILHVDFFQVHAGEKLHVEIPIILNGTPIGVREEGGILQEVFRELTVECLPSNIPASIEISVDHLHLGDTIHVSDIPVDKFEILNDSELVICTVVAPTLVASETEDADADEEPEVIGEAEADGEDEAAE